METVGDRIKLARERCSLSQAELARRIGVKRASVNQWETGQTRSIKADNLLKAAKVLGIRPEWLQTGRGDMTIAPAPAEVRPIGTDTRRIPVISYIQAGHPREVVDAYAEGNGFDTVGVDPELAERLGPHTFALVVEGESMLPEFRPGDTVIIDPDAPVRPGDIVVARLEREQAATLKKYRSRGEDDQGHPVFELVPLNDDYPTLLVNAANPGQVIGPVIEHRRRLR